jgi:hypothetical protein
VDENGSFGEGVSRIDRSAAKLVESSRGANDLPFPHEA